MCLRVRTGSTPDLREPEVVAQSDGFGAVGRRVVLLDGGAVDATVHDRGRMACGSRVTGPAVVEFPEATCLVRPGWAGVVDAVGTLVLERES